MSEEPEERVYTIAEGRTLVSRSECEKTGHQEYTLRVSDAVRAVWFGLPPLPPPSGDRTWECGKCDAVVTVRYPVIGRVVES